MSAESNKAQSRRFFEEVFTKGKMDAITEIFAANHVNHGPGTLQDLPDGPEGVRQVVSFYRKAFPDTQFTIDEQVAEGDRVVTRWTVHGTQKGEMPGIPVTGRPATVTGVTVDRFVNGKIVESWGIFDQMGMLQQLGVVPMQGQSGTKR
jgi:steroid delta-isomerase-like uncharacterized protein